MLWNRYVLEAGSDVTKLAIVSASTDTRIGAALLITTKLGLDSIFSILPSAKPEMKLHKCIVANKSILRVETCLVIAM